VLYKDVSMDEVAKQIKALTPDGEGVGELTMMALLKLWAGTRYH
jgi:5,10-methylene-tetrahydrofolate dehydrogenase/methenyl tetrahydrofolate cyclohydrolase